MVLSRPIGKQYTKRYGTKNLAIVCYNNNVLFYLNLIYNVYFMFLFQCCCCCCFWCVQFCCRCCCCCFVRRVCCCRCCCGIDGFVSFIVVAISPARPLFAMLLVLVSCCCCYCCCCCYYNCTTSSSSSSSRTSTNKDGILLSSRTPAAAALSASIVSWALIASSAVIVAIAAAVIVPFVPRYRFDSFLFCGSDARRCNKINKRRRSRETTQKGGGK